MDLISRVSPSINKGSEDELVRNLIPTQMYTCALLFYKNDHSQKNISVEPETSAFHLNLFLSASRKSNVKGK